MFDRTFEQVDQDGALLGAVEGAFGRSRAEFLTKALVTGGVLLGALALPRRARSQEDDLSILNFDLAFEYLQATFYTEAEQLGTVDAMTAEQALWARTLGSHERAHVKIIKSVLGKAAVKRPAFNFGGATDTPESFTKTAVAMEDLTVSLLVGQADRFQSPDLVAALFTLITTEARHATWARRIEGFTPIGKAFDDPMTLAQVDKVVATTNFVDSKLKTVAEGDPRFTG